MPFTVAGYRNGENDGLVRSGFTTDERTKCNETQYLKLLFTRAIYDMHLLRYNRFTFGFIAQTFGELKVATLNITETAKDSVHRLLADASLIIC